LIPYWPFLLVIVGKVESLLRANGKAQMSNDEKSRNNEAKSTSAKETLLLFELCHSSVIRHSDFDIFSI